MNHTLRPRHLPVLTLTSMACAIAMLGTAHAQQAAPLPAAAASAAPAAAAKGSAAQDNQQLETVIITGTAVGRTKLSAPFAISTFSESQIERSAPLSTVDLLKRVPGFSAEASGGQGGGQNIIARGLPAGGWFFVQLQQNGLTLFDEPQESFLNIDTLHRVDMMTERAEVVRGGTSPIFANNAPGGTVNFITRHGTQEREGAVRLTTGSHGLVRTDGYVSGPVNDRLSYAVGGFYRQDKGLREPGYTADKGGQITGSASLRLDRGHVDVDLRVLNDKTAFYTPIPLNDPRDPSRSLDAQLDQGTGTLASNDFRNFKLRSFDGAGANQTQRDLADGIHADVKQFNLSFEHELAPAWKITNRLGVLDAKVSYDAVFSGAAPQDQAAYLAGKLTAAQSGFGPTVTRVGYVLANARDASGQRIGFDPSSVNGLVLESGLNSVDTRVRTVTDDLRFTGTFEPSKGGRHDLALGLYYSVYSFKQQRNPNLILTSLQDRPAALDVLAYDAAGKVVGSVTENGFVRYGNGMVRGSATGFYLSPYIADEWHVGDKIVLDAGLRHTLFHASGTQDTAGSRNLGDPTTLADNNVGGFTGATTTKKESLRGTSWTLGAAYKPDPNQQLFARYTKSVRFPRLQNVYLGQTNPVTDIDQAEAGWRTAGALSFSAIGFWSHFNRLTTNGLILDPLTGNFVSRALIGETETYGLEGEVNYRPSSLFSVNANVTLQQPKTKNVADPLTGSVGANVSNKQIISIPKLIFSVQPVVNLSVADRPVELSATVSYVGDRYVDYANTTRLPAYTTLDLGVLASLTPSIDLQFLVKNATNSHGLTEGNPRTDTIAGQGTATAIYGRPIFGRNYQASLTYHF